MEYKDILVGAEAEIGTITLNSPKTINALSKNMIAELIVPFGEWEKNPRLQAMTSVGPCGRKPGCLNLARRLPWSHQRCRGQGIFSRRLRKLDSSG